MQTPTISKVYTPLLPDIIVKNLCNLIQIPAKSTAIKKAMLLSLLLPSDKLVVDPTEQFIHVTDGTILRKKTRISIRLHDELLLAIQHKIAYDDTLKNKLSFDDIILCAILTYIKNYQNIPSTSCLGKNNKTIHVIGNKWTSEMMEYIKKIVKSAGLDVNKTLETCAGSLGIHANIKIADTEILNDDDVDKMNFYRCVQKYPKELVEKCLAMDISEDTFKKIKARYENYNLNNKTANLCAAADFFYLNLLSDRNTGNSFNKRLRKTYNMYCTNIYHLYLRIKDTKLEQKDLFKQIKKHKNETDILMFVDPPYLFTNHYENRTVSDPQEYGTAFDMKQHEKLAKELMGIKGYFVYFCRITATRTKDCHNNLTIPKEQLKQNDLKLKNIIDFLYKYDSTYYLDVPLEKSGAIERIITNFPFEDAKKFVS